MKNHAIVAISLTVGLVLMQVVHGQDETKQLINNTQQYALCLDIPDHKALDEKLICDSLWGEDGIRVEEIESDNGLIIDDNPTVDRDALISKLGEIKQYCLDHTDKILAGGNPVQDLINAGMIRQDTFQNITCQEVDKEIFWTEAGKGENLKDALGID